MNTPPKGDNNPKTDQFVRRKNPETGLDLSSKESRDNEKRERNLNLVLAQTTIPFKDAEKLASLGLEHFESDWVARRATKEHRGRNRRSGGTSSRVVYEGITWDQLEPSGRDPSPHRPRLRERRSRDHLDGAQR